jgi:hypothetical protein
MKKIFFALALVSIVTVTHAQHFQLGVKAGPNVSNFLNGNFDAVKKKALVGIHAGAYFRIKFANFAIQPEAMISTQGAKIDSLPGVHDWKITYVNVPVLVQYYFNRSFYLEVGPQIGFVTNQNFADETIRDFANDLDFSIAMGFGVRSKSGLGIGMRYNAGISKVGDFSPSNGIDPDFKNGVLQLSVYIPLTPAKK